MIKKNVTVKKKQKKTKQTKKKKKHENCWTGLQLMYLYLLCLQD